MADTRAVFIFNAALLPLITIMKRRRQTAQLVTLKVKVSSFIWRESLLSRLGTCSTFPSLKLKWFSLFVSDAAFGFIWGCGFITVSFKRLQTGQDAGQVEVRVSYGMLRDADCSHNVGVAGPGDPACHYDHHVAWLEESSGFPWGGRKHRRTSE